MDRFTLAIVGAVLGLVVAGLVVAAAWRGPAPPPDLSTPAGTVMAYALAEQRGDTPAAWDLLATSVQASNSRDQFLVRAANRGTEREYLSTEDERIEPDSASASVVLVHTFAATGGIFGNSNRTFRTTARLVREGSGWRITVPPDPYVLSSTRP